MIPGGVEAWVSILDGPTTMGMVCLRHDLLSCALISFVLFCFGVSVAQLASNIDRLKYWRLQARIGAD